MARSRTQSRTRSRPCEGQAARARGGAPQTQRTPHPGQFCTQGSVRVGATPHPRQFRTQGPAGPPAPPHPGQPATHTLEPHAHQRTPYHDPKTKQGHDPAPAPHPPGQAGAKGPRPKHSHGDHFLILKKGTQSQATIYPTSEKGTQSEGTFFKIKKRWPVRGYLFLILKNGGQSEGTFFKI